MHKEIKLLLKRKEIKMEKNLLKKQKSELMERLKETTIAADGTRTTKISKLGTD